MTEKPLILDEATQKNLDSWLYGNYDQSVKDKIKDLIVSSPNDVVDAFYTRLSFGTGGLRGIMGVGTNRMNAYTVRAATQGLANYLLKQPKTSAGLSVIIGFDTRQNSRSFAEECAKVLAGNGIKVYLLKGARPSPLVSFGVRMKGCSAGIMITASHNPPKYNGYKVYWNDGGQVLPPHDKGIIFEVNSIVDTNQVKMVEKLIDPLIEIVDGEVDAAYYVMMSSFQNYPDENLKYGNNLKIVYTSLHGTGISLAPQLLKQWGFTRLSYVDSQIIPDGSFPTVTLPNPEEREALEMGIEKLKRSQAEILIATDPDADRVGVVVRHGEEVTVFDGNQIACICLEHICRALTDQNRFPKNAAFIKSIVTTELFQEICKAYGKRCFDVLTGFKYFSAKIQEWDLSQSLQYIFGGEESYGYLLGTYVRDKDGISSAALICEAALHAKRENKTLVDLLHEIYRKYGVYIDRLSNLKFDDSKEGREKIARGIAKLENSPPKEINGIEVIFVEDYQKGIKTDIRTGKQEPLDYPPNHMTILRLIDGSKIAIRPSGTEPKIKIYSGVVEKQNIGDIGNAILRCERKALKLIEEVKDLLA